MFEENENVKTEKEGEGRRRRRRRRREGGGGGGGGDMPASKIRGHLALSDGEGVTATKRHTYKQTHRKKTFVLIFQSKLILYFFLSFNTA